MTEAPRPSRPSLGCRAAGLAVFVAGSALAYILFVAMAVLAEPTRNNALLALGVFLLLAVTGLAYALGILTTQRLHRRRLERELRARHGEVHGGDWRSGDEDGSAP